MRQKNIIMSNVQKKTSQDLWIIVIATLIPLFVYLCFGKTIMNMARNETQSIYLRLLPALLTQYGLAGFGISLVMFFRKEKLTDYALHLKNCLLAIVLTLLFFIPHFVFMFFDGTLNSYLPFQGMFLTRTILTEPFPQNVLLYLLVSLVWGFFEGFNYVVISQKINIVLPSKYKWLNWGALLCAIVCLLIHGMIGFDLRTFFEALTTFVFVYGMILCKDLLKNSWGVIFAFFFLWNAF